MTPLDMMVTDRNAEYLGIPGLTLMENAGKCLAQQISFISEPCKVNIFTGSGGNGGDGFVAARHLLNKGFKVEIFALTHPSRINSKEARSNWEVLQNMEPYLGNLKINMITDSSQLKSSVRYSPVSADDGEENGNEEIMVDAILGTGIKGQLREPVRSVIEFINNSSAIRVAVDVPSGMDPLNGEVQDLAVKADYTVTFHKAKLGLTKGSSDYVGNLIVCDIGIPREAELFLGDGDLLRIKKRDETSHKGLNGKILVVGGSKDYTGAPALAAMAALSAGVDLAFIACPEEAALPIKSYSPDLIVKGLQGKNINPKMVDEILDMSKKVDCVLIGCGAGQDPETGEAFNSIVEKLIQMQKPLVLDADALKLVDKKLVKSADNVVVTPHSSEFKAFFGDNTPVMLFDLKEKISAFQSISQQIKGAVLIKGKLDLIFQDDKFRLNKTGSPGMTVGGTGDCLAGLLCALMSQGLSSFDSAGLGAFINGRAGELAEEEYGYNFTASQMLKYIPLVMKIQRF